MNSTLPGVLNETEVELIHEARQLNKVPVWTMWTDNLKEGVFQSAHNQSIIASKSIENLNWGPGEPNGKTLENCVIFEEDKSLSDNSCFADYAVSTVCQMNKIPFYKLRGTVHEITSSNVVKK